MSNNTSDDGRGEENIEDEFSVTDLGPARYESIAERPSRKFQGWHRPRKQFVRQSQWLACVKDLYQDRDPADRVNYLGLPGTDLLDLRVLHEEICVPQQRTLRFLGFHNGINPDSAENVNLDISLQQVKLRQLVHEGSKVLHDDFRRIGSGDSRAFQEAKRTAPYDVINLDLTSGFATDAPHSLDSLYNALNTILAMQRVMHPWVLFVTGIVSREQVNIDTARILHGIFLDSLRCEGFPEACAPYFESEDLSLLNIESCSNHDYLRVVSVGFCVWIFQQAQQQQPNRVNLRAAFYYQIYPQASGPDMISIAIRFTPQIVAPPDSAGLASGQAPEESNCDTAIQFAKKFASAVDVDETLRTNVTLREKLINESAVLLVDAGYDEAQYREWVAQYTS